MLWYSSQRADLRATSRSATEPPPERRGPAVPRAPNRPRRRAGSSRWRRPRGERRGPAGEFPEEAELLVRQLGRSHLVFTLAIGGGDGGDLRGLVADHHRSRDQVPEPLAPRVDRHEEDAEGAEQVDRKEQVARGGVGEGKAVAGVAD